MILAISDIHGYLPYIPPCEVLIIAGDVCPVYNHELSFQLQWLDTNFRLWLENILAKRIVGIAGNHDFVFQKRPREVAALKLPWRYLQDSSMKYKGIWYYGIPWVPKLMNWAFYANDKDLEKKYRAIPRRTDVVISHGPPYGILDMAQGAYLAGSEAALKSIHWVKPCLFVCGHIHEAAGAYYHGSTETMVVNASYVDENYDPQLRVSMLDIGLTSANEAVMI